MFSIARDPGANTVLYYQNKKRRKSTVDFVPSIQVSRKSSKMVTSKQEIERTFEKMDIEKKSQHQQKQRLTNKDSYIKYNFNPFSMNKSQKQLLKASPNKIVNIVEQRLVKNQTKSTVEIRALKDRQNIEELRYQAERSVGKTINNIQKIQLKGINTCQSFLMENNRQEKKSKERGLQNTFNNQQFGLSNFEIGQIAKIKEDNHFFEKQRGKINIFLLARKTNDKISGYEHLKEKRFSFNGIIQKNYKNKTNIYREVSRLGRATICGYYIGEEKMLDYLNSNQLILDEKHHNFEDLLNIATNRINPNVVQEIHQNHEDRQNDSQDSLQTGHPHFHNIITKLKSFGANFKAENQDQHIKSQYRITEFEEKQKKQVNKLRKKIEAVEKLQEKQKNIYENQIRDRKLHEALLSQAKQNVKSLILVSKDKQKSIDQMVRQKRIENDRSSRLKIEQINMLLKDKYEMQKKYNLLKREAKK